MLRVILLRLLPLLILTAAIALWFGHVQDGSRFLYRNLLPPVIVLLLAGLMLWRGGGQWTGTGWQLLLGTVGFAIPALGLAVYLHYAYAVNLNGMFGDPADPGALFRFLPLYTTGAGTIGFAIGWIVGKNL